jgi:hypothetical protein
MTRAWRYRCWSIKRPFWLLLFRGHWETGQPYVGLQGGDTGALVRFMATVGHPGFSLDIALGDRSLAVAKRYGRLSVQAWRWPAGRRAKIVRDSR